ncbi:MAG: hypothetical protein HOO92_08955 [Methylococcaceae bacterium]|nr:hypothetical protein [Methylococcaceae bacterium]
MLIYSSFSLLAYFISQRYYAHYLILSLPALVIIMGVSLSDIAKSDFARVFISIWVILFSCAIATTKTGTILRGIKGYIALSTGQAPDTPTQISKEILKKINPNETIYVYAYHPILYYLTGVNLPTQYFFSEHHLSSVHAESLGFKSVDEMDHILSQSPRYIIAGSDPEKVEFGSASQLLNDVLKKNYKLKNTYEWPERSGQILLYERN